MKNGDIYKTNKYGYLKVVNYINCSNVEIEFIDTGYATKTFAASIRNGAVKDLLKPIIKGVGYIGIGAYTAKSKAYKTWAKMLYRCYSLKSLEKRPTYIGCKVDPRWHNFQEFAKWYEENYVDGYQLDKDLLVVGNRMYSPENCIFVPLKVNCFITNSLSIRGEYPIGVSYYKQTNKYVAKCSDGSGMDKHLGYFEDYHQASLAWKKFKLSLAKQMKPVFDELDVRIYKNVLSMIHNAK